MTQGRREQQPEVDAVDPYVLNNTDIRIRNPPPHLVFPGWAHSLLARSGAATFANRVQSDQWQLPVIPAGALTATLAETGVEFY
jgi:hypothetical protein